MVGNKPPAARPLSSSALPTRSPAKTTPKSSSRAAGSPGAASKTLRTSKPPPPAVVGSGSCQIPPGTVPTGDLGVPAGGHLPLPSSPGTGRKGRCCCAGLYRFRMAWRFLLGSNPNSRNVFHRFRWSLQSARAHGEQQPRVLGPPLRGEGCKGGASPPLPRSPRPFWEAQLPSPSPKHPEKRNQRDTRVLGGQLGVFWDGSGRLRPRCAPAGEQGRGASCPCVESSALSWKAAASPGLHHPERNPCLGLGRCSPDATRSGTVSSCTGSLGFPRLPGCSIHGWTGGQTDRQPRSSCPRGAGLCRNPSKSQGGAARNV